LQLLVKSAVHCERRQGEARKTECV
jgi:hypothetical protein